MKFMYQPNNKHQPKKTSILCYVCVVFVVNCSKLIEHHIRLIKIINRVVGGLRNHFQFKCFHFHFTFRLLNQQLDQQKYKTENKEIK